MVPARVGVGHNAQMSEHLRFGIDVGGSGIKGTPVDVGHGTLVEERHRIPTPEPATPDAVAGVVADLVAHFGWDGPVGVAFPAVVRDGVTCTAANVDPAWIGCDARRLLGDALGRPVALVNDADAAGLAEMRFGAGRGQEGTVLVLTLGTGIGTALFHRGVLVPNTELGHIEMHGEDAEARASADARKRLDLSWTRWAANLGEYLFVMERLLWPDLIVIGGGVSKKSDRFFPLLETQAPLVAAHLHNEAGIVGAALIAPGAPGSDDGPPEVGA